MTWVSAMPLERLRRDGKSVVKLARRQIALFAAGDAVFACNNRCPHEGYPLREGTVNGDCVLTCNWHGWKFDLKTGDNLFQGDRLRLYPIGHRRGIPRRADPRWIGIPRAVHDHAVSRDHSAQIARRVAHVNHARCMSIHVNVGNVMKG